MKKINPLLAMIVLICSNSFYAQSSTESFETESHGSTSFTDNGVIFNILSHVGTFRVQGNFPGTGWNGTANDNRYIDNSNSSESPASFSIRTTSNLFKVNRFWIYLSAFNLDLNVDGTLTITGKLSGVTKFTQTKTTGFATSLGSTNGFTLINLVNLNGQNYSNIVIDQLQLTLGGAFRYASLDAFTWVKDSNIVLAVDDTQSKVNDYLVYPNPASDFISFNNAKDIQKVEIYDLSGKLIISSDKAEKVNVSQLEKGTYVTKLKMSNETVNSKFIKK
ncbi:T9SS type A sorting domain-containing protein [Epilithonimonas zeae]|uniref:T9SS type A sorting domain-containing protein n=1 Tax=Epilithonimonas zeae TaxID=1416779 RepID=UPI00200FF878|nr:T9SS type A sorting domain-containing protein [Epilithonimonas zeae]UQB68849.1 T9SS type A sorting domain-containing protein [Epilithonimonas zeae]